MSQEMTPTSSPAVGGFFTTTIGKVATVAVSATLIGAIAISTYAFVTSLDSNDSNPAPNTTESSSTTSTEASTTESTSSESTEVQYTDERLPEFAVNYDGSIWELEENERESSLGLGEFTNEITFKNKLNSAEARLNLSVGFMQDRGPAACVDGGSDFDKLVSADRGIFRFQPAAYTNSGPAEFQGSAKRQHEFGNFYYTTEYTAKGTAEFTSLISNFPQGVGQADFCYQLTDDTSTNIPSSGIIKETNPQIKFAGGQITFTANVDTSQSAAEVESQLEQIDELRLGVQY